jgi:hypothetical protein
VLIKKKSINFLKKVHEKAYAIHINDHMIAK